MKKIKIALNPNRNIAGIHKETREMVLKNFPEYNKEDLYEFNHLSFGLLVRKEENEKYMLLESTCRNWGEEILYVVYNKQTSHVVLDIKVMSYDGGEVHLDNDNFDNVIVILNNPTSNWTCSNYMFLDFRLYGYELLHTCEPYVNDIVSEDGKNLGFSTEHGKGLYVSEWIAYSVNDIKNYKWESNKIYCKLI